MGCQGLSPSWSHTRQMPYPRYYHPSSLLPYLLLFVFSPHPRPECKPTGQDIYFLSSQVSNNFTFTETWQRVPRVLLHAPSLCFLLLNFYSYVAMETMMVITVNSRVDFVWISLILPKCPFSVPKTHPGFHVAIS